MSLLPPSARLVGTRVARTEDHRLLAGRGCYVDDVAVPGMLHVAFARSDVARARIRTLDTTAAGELPGVVAVVTADELNHRLAGSMMATPTVGHGPELPQRALAHGDVRYAGEPYALVVAESRGLAEDAIELIELGLDPLPAIVDYTTALHDSELVHPDTDSNLAGEVVVAADDALRQALAGAAHATSATFVQNRYHPVPMEPRGIIASWDPARRAFEVWASTQSPHDVRTVASRITGVPERDIRVWMGDVGGGFGQKAYLARDEQVVLLASHLLGRPLKWIEDRRENLMAATSARAERATVTLAADGDGRFVGIDVDHLDEVGAFPIVSSATQMASMVFTGPYRIPGFAMASRSAFTNTCPRAPYRGPWQIETYAREQAVDALARVMGVDPLELRRRNVVRREELPHVLPNGLPVTDVSPEETLEQAASLIGYDDFRAWQQTELGAGRLVGVGIGLYIEPQAAFGVYSTEPTHLRIGPDGAVDVYLGSGSHGQGLETTTAQLVSDHLGVAFESITVHQGDTAATPYAFGTGGSRSGPVLGAAIQETALLLRAKVASLAAHLLEAAVDDLEIVDGVISVRGTPTSSCTIADVARLAYHGIDALPPGAEPGLEVLHRYRSERPLLFSNACHMCTVSVDTATGTVRVLRYVVSEDCGVMINPDIVEGQIAGGVAQGIGGVLLEDFRYDDEGNPLTTTFLDYLLPTAADVPVIEYGHIETPAPTPGHHKGVGEGGAIGAPAAVANAVNDALTLVGAELHEAPMTPTRVLAALSAARAANQPRTTPGDST